MAEFGNYKQEILNFDKNGREILSKSISEKIGNTNSITGNMINTINNFSPLDLQNLQFDVNYINNLDYFSGGASGPQTIAEIFPSVMNIKNGYLIGLGPDESVSSDYFEIYGYTKLNETTKLKLCRSTYLRDAEMTYAWVYFHKHTDGTYWAITYDNQQFVNLKGWGYKTSGNVPGFIVFGEKLN